MRKETFLFIGLLVYGYLFMVLKPVMDPGIGFAAFGVAGVFMLWAYVLSTKKRISPTGQAIGFLAVLQALSFALFENSTIQEPLCLATVGFAALFAYYAGNMDFAMGTLPGVAGLFTFSIFDNLSEKAQMLFHFKKERKGLWQALIGFAVALPILGILIGLLANADAAFEGAVEGIAAYVNKHLFEQALYIAAAVLIAAYLYSLFLSAAPKNRGQWVITRHVPTAIAAMVLLLVNLLYAFFFAVQLREIWGAGSEAYALSALAREGFFELCWVCGINFLLFTVFHKLVPEKKAGMRFLLLLLCVMSQAIIITALLKMNLYIANYGLTLLRVQTIWFMVSLFSAFVLMEIRLFKKMPLFKWVAVLCAISIVVASYADIGGMVARGNAERYMKGELKAFEVRQYTHFPYEAAPELMALYEQTREEELKEKLMDFMRALDSRAEEAVWYQSVQKINVEKALDDFLKNR